ncbi:glutamine amidotransferase [Hyphomicrobiales bacterium 4NK60-0047b]
MSEAKKLCIAVRHLQFEGLGVFEEPVAKAGYEIQYIDAPVEKLDRAYEADLLFILGGPCGVYEDELYPYIKDELALAKHRIDHQLSMVGVCLGAQIIAAAAGAKVYPGPNGKEIGWGPISLTEGGRNGPLSPLLLREARMFHWHGDTFDLPKGATLLASSELYENQIYSLGNNILGFQSHPELDPQNIEHWLIGHACELAHTPQVDLLQIRADTKRYGDSLRANGVEALSNWLQTIE